jgi:hypothetical protein
MGGGMTGIAARPCSGSIEHAKDAERLEFK